jgi:hypothetical protein
MISMDRNVAKGENEGGQKRLEILGDVIPIYVSGLDGICSLECADPRVDYFVHCLRATVVASNFLASDPMKQTELIIGQHNPSMLQVLEGPGPMANT